MTTDTPTPMTDADAGTCTCCVPDEWVSADFARTLERDLTAARQRIEGMEALIAANLTDFTQGDKR